MTGIRINCTTGVGHLSSAEFQNLRHTSGELGPVLIASHIGGRPRRNSGHLWEALQTPRQCNLCRVLISPLVDLPGVVLPTFYNGPVSVQLDEPAPVDCPQEPGTSEVFEGTGPMAPE